MLRFDGSDDSRPGYAQINSSENRIYVDDEDEDVEDAQAGEDAAAEAAAAAAGARHGDQELQAHGEDVELVYEDDAAEVRGVQPHHRTSDAVMAAAAASVGSVGGGRRGSDGAAGATTLLFEGATTNQNLTDEGDDGALLVSPASDLGDHGALEYVDEGAPFWQRVRVEITALMKLAWPVVVAFGARMSLGIVNLLFLGHLESSTATAIAAASLANMYANVTGSSVGVGIATAMDTLCAQAHGAKNYKLLGRILQRASLIFIVVCIPIFFVWLYTENVLLLAGQDPEVAALAGTYVRCMIPGLWPMLLFEAQSKFLQAQGHVMPPLVISAIVSLLHPLFVHLFVNVMGIGFAGAPIALSLANILLAVGLAAIIYFKKLHVQCWPKWSWEVMQDWIPFLKLGIPGMIMVCAEWWAFEIVALGAGWLGQEQLATQGIVLNTLAVCFMMPLGVGVAASMRVGNWLGANRPAAARFSALVAMAVAVFLEFLENIVLVVYHTSWGYLFTNDPAVVQLVSHVLLLIVCFSILDGLQAVQSSVLRGCGRQSIGAIFNICAYSLIGVPLSYALAFGAHLDLDGLWIGLATALLLQNTSLGFIISRTDWSEQARKAKERVSDGSFEPVATVEAETELVAVPALTSTSLNDIAIVHDTDSESDT